MFACCVTGLAIESALPLLYYRYIKYVGIFFGTWCIEYYLQSQLEGLCIHCHTLSMQTHQVEIV